MVWTIKRTDIFLESIAQVRNNKKIIAELGKKSPGYQKILCISGAGFPARFMERNPKGLQNNTGSSFSG